ncbi:PREDICTED: uncharacterized protein LOC106812441 [Priapulus caudatus]|uniref:Uncharacterized protein LOC106812441 n=1 Tax=Priapulus caudatus TaxID=37621 RepID=A0ABM1EHZ5_PRICU|nr:PREDICTED: uncharacterized protein LOC106812441 [Priapulus caudatus]
MSGTKEKLTEINLNDSIHEYRRQCDNTSSCQIRDGPYTFSVYSCTPDALRTDICTENCSWKFPRKHGYLASAGYPQTIGVEGKQPISINLCSEPSVDRVMTIFMMNSDFCSGNQLIVTNDRSNLAWPGQQGAALLAPNSTITIVQASACQANFLLYYADATLFNCTGLQQTLNDGVGHLIRTPPLQPKNTICSWIIHILPYRTLQFIFHEFLTGTCVTITEESSKRYVNDCVQVQEIVISGVSGPITVTPWDYPLVPDATPWITYRVLPTEFSSVEAAATPLPGCPPKIGNDNLTNFYNLTSPVRAETWNTTPAEEVSPYAWGFLSGGAFIDKGSVIPAVVIAACSTVIGVILACVVCCCYHRSKNSSKHRKVSLPLTAAKSSREVEEAHSMQPVAAQGAAAALAVTVTEPPRSHAGSHRRRTRYNVKVKNPAARAVLLPITRYSQHVGISFYGSDFEGDSDDDDDAQHAEPIYANVPPSVRRSSDAAAAAAPPPKYDSYVSMRPNANDYANVGANRNNEHEYSYVD